MGQALIEAALAMPEVVSPPRSTSRARRQSVVMRASDSAVPPASSSATTSLRRCAAPMYSSTSRGPRARWRTSRRAPRPASRAVVGTTGLNDAQKAELALRAKTVPIVYAANMSVGVVVLLSLVEPAAAKLGPGYDIEIVEMHHKHKVDAPSGTALQLGDAAAAGTGRKLADCAVYAREGHTGDAYAGRDRLRVAARRRCRRRAYGDLRGHRRARRALASRDVAAELRQRRIARRRFRRAPNARHGIRVCTTCGTCWD